MGKNNQRTKSTQRRAAKRRARAASVAARGHGVPGAGTRTGPGHPDPPTRRPERPADPPESAIDQNEQIARLLATGASCAFGERTNESVLDEVVQSLVVLQTTAAAQLTARLGTDAVFQHLGYLWEGGWQPLDVTHIVRRHQGARGAALVTAAIAGQSTLDRHFDRAPQEWIDQLESLGIAAEQPKSVDWLIGGWQFAKGISAWEGWRDILRLLGQFQELHQLTPLGPPPSQWDRIGKAKPAMKSRAEPSAAQQAGGAGHDPKMLGKIRALLSKAEATTFEEEAEALTTKAQDLMTRYAIDEALLEESGGHGDVGARRIHIDNPYAQAKVQLLSTVGSINRVRVVWDDQHGMATVVGMAVDMELVDLLFTSLLVQATRALAEVGNTRINDGGYQSGRLNRSPSFRRAFLLAYATRIGERLAEAGERATADSSSSHGAELVPVLARRAEEVDRRFDKMFPDTQEIRSKRVDARGWHAGRSAADRAVFAAGQVEGARTEGG
ncbi:MAG: DUF2786 domain-containing protein [Nakamurella sp.]